ARLVVVALLTHATLCLAVRHWFARILRSEAIDDLNWLSALRGWALFSTVAALPAFGFALQTQTLLFLTITTLWLAALCAEVAWHEHWPGLFTTAQGTLVIAVLFLVSDWLLNQDWFFRFPHSLVDPRSFYAYCLGLSVLCLLLLFAKMLLRRRENLQVLY